MNGEVTKQIVESLALIIAPLLSITLAYYFVKKLLICKNNIEREITLLEDAQYYRALIEKYKNILEELENKNYYKTFRKDIEFELGYSSSQYTAPAQISTRLRYLKRMKENIDRNMSKMEGKL